MMKNNAERKLYKCVLSDKGSTLITVIVAIAFVTILTTIILGTTLVNVRMKGIDRRTHNDFYYAERSLNDLYTGMGQDLAELAGNLYEAEFKKLGTKDDPSYDYNKAKTAEDAFRAGYLEGAHDLIDKLDGTSDNKVTTAALNEYILDISKGKVENNTAIDIEYQKKDGSNATLSTAYRVALKSVEVSVEDTSGYRSTITTDIIINIPSVDFLGTNVDVSDYGLIANKGLYIDASAGPVTINGNVYAGTHETANSMDDDFDERTDAYSRTPVYGGINIQDGTVTFNGNYIISKGDINLAGTNPRIVVNSSKSEEDTNLANLWFTSIRTLSDATLPPVPTPTPTPSPTPTVAPTPTPIPDPTIDINANTFALNDMILNAKNSSAVINGNYYGYNDGSLTDILGKKTGREDAENSAIIINGSKSYLYMRDIKNFVLMGKAYIDFTSSDQTKVADMGSLAQVVPTAEGVALKTNQQIYLVPPDFLDGPNPIQGGTGVFKLDTTIDLEKWFGYNYLNNSIIHQKYEVKTNSGSVYYDYLVFDEGVNWKPTEVTNPDEDSHLFVDGKYSGKDVKYIATKNSDGTYKILKYTEDTDPLGTGGSISSKAMFFLKIMTARSTYECAYERAGGAETSGFDTLDAYVENKEITELQPSAYRLFDRIDRSMGWDYFDLSECVVGDSSAPGNAHYYAKNAVINYQRDVSDSGKIQSNVLNNTDGMLRYAGYTPNLFKRYIFLCTELNGKEDQLFETPDIGTPRMSDWTITSNAPMSRYVILPTSAMTMSTSVTYADAAGLKPGAYGVCVATKLSTPFKIGADLTSGLVGTTFKGVAIVDGDIVVEEGYNVDGLLMATGTITLKGRNEINYNKGLIQSRIEKELNIIKSTDPSVTPAPADPRDYYLIDYLAAENESHVMKPIYSADKGTKMKKERIEADYNEFMHFENWQKGEK